MLTIIKPVAAHKKIFYTYFKYTLVIFMHILTYKNYEKYKINIALNKQHQNN